MKTIDTTTWSRKIAYENFSKYDNPIFSIGTRFDVTKLVAYCKENKKSFFSTFLYVLTRSANEIDELKIRIVEGKVVLFDTICPSFVILGEGDDLSTCKSEYYADYATFYECNRADIERVRSGRSEKNFNGEAIVDCLYISTLPWIDVTAVENPYNFKDEAQTSIPRITWGKYVKRGDIYEMGIHLSAHHALMDGVHLSRLVEKMQTAIDNIEEYLK